MLFWYFTYDYQVVEELLSFIEDKNVRKFLRWAFTFGVLGFIIAVIYYLPIWDLIVLFGALVVIPMMFFWGVGWITRETFFGFMSLMNRDVQQNIRDATDNVRH